MKLLQSLFLPLVAAVFAAHTAFPAPPQGGQLVFTDEANPAPRGQFPVSGGSARVDPSPFVAHIPGAKNAPTPSWVVPGARLTMWVGTATVSESGSVTTMVPDPNGSLVDGNGKRYRQSSAGGAANPGGSGCGYMQLDVLHVSALGVKVDIRNYVGDGKYSAPQVQMVTGTMLNGGSCEYWINPSLLAKVKSGQHGIVNVLKGNWEVQGKNYNAVIFKHGNNGGNRGHSVYDLKTGVSLSWNSLTRSKANHTRFDPTSGRYGGGSTNNKTMSNSFFMGVRQMQLPWANEPFSPRADQFKSAVYTGQMGIEPSNGVPSSPQTDHVRVAGREPGCIHVGIKKQFMGMDPATTPEMSRYTAVHQVVGFLINPSALRKLQKGQSIDKDPITGQHTYVEYVGASYQGNQVVGIVEETAGSTLRWIYDLQTGELFGYATILPMGGMGASVSQYQRSGR